MPHRMKFFALMALAAVAMVLGKDPDYLAEKPDFVKSCKLTDPDFNKCFAKNFEGIFKIWKDGVPGLNSVGPADPLYIKRIRAKQEDDNPLVHMSVECRNVIVTGISDVEIKDISIDFDGGTSTVKLRAPRLEAQSNYKVKGRLLNMPLDSKGSGRAQVDDLNFDVVMHFKLRDEFGYTFADVDKLSVEVTDIGGFHIDVENLFNGDKDLENTMNGVMNDNWREFYAVLGPVMKDTVQDLMFDRIKKVFAYVPAIYFVEDVPTAAQFYGYDNL